MSQHQLPDGLVLIRTTDVFDNATVPASLLRAHRVADGVWGRLVVHYACALSGVSGQMLPGMGSIPIVAPPIHIWASSVAAVPAGFGAIAVDGRA